MRTEDMIFVTAGSQQNFLYLGIDLQYRQDAQREGYNIDCHARCSIGLLFGL
jgi:hypothetical protein